MLQCLKMRRSATIRRLMAATLMVLLTTPGDSFLYNNHARFGKTNVKASWSQEVDLLPDDTTQTKECTLSPRLWLEDTADGAYTVIRCDFLEETHHAWGIDFHLKRLYYGVQSLYDSISSEEVATATASTQLIVESFLSSASEELSSRNLNWCKKDGTFSSCVGMVTVLWVVDEESGRITVKGHFFTTAEVTDKLDFPPPIQAVVAIDSSLRKATIPSRKLPDPLVKHSSWCRIRRTLEDRYLVEGAKEVLLADQAGEVTTLLEGLTNNLFVVYPNDEIGTCTNHVLHGYAQTRVTEAAERLGYTVRAGPICLAESALWKEVFVTSSIQLVRPLERVSLPGNDGCTPVEIWSRTRVDPSLLKNIVAQKIYTSIIEEELGSWNSFGS